MASDYPEHWKLTRVPDAVEAIIDYRGKTPKKRPFGIPLVTAKIIKGGRILTPEEFIAAEDYDAWMRRGLPRLGDVVITTEAPLGEVARLDDARVALAQRVILLRGREGFLSNGFLKYLLQSRFIQDQLHGMGTGTTATGISQKDLRQVKLPIPPLSEQNVIGGILGALDDKIALNRRMNRTLENMASALFKSWFVDFDPVVAKAAGREPFGVDDATARLFPSTFRESQLGLIPKDWEAGTLGAVAINSRAGARPNSHSGSEAYIGLEHMPRRSIALTEWASPEGLLSGKFVFHKGDILFGKLRPYFHKVGVAPANGICSTDILVIWPRSAEWYGFVLGHASSIDMIDYADGASTGTKMPRIGWRELAAYKVVLPPEVVAGKFTNLVMPLINRLVANSHECHSLVRLRDGLLPQLLSGELRIDTMEKRVGELL